MSGLRRMAASKSSTRQPSTMVSECSSTCPLTSLSSTLRGVLPGRISYSPALIAPARPFHRA
jgi:hypothetical protein